MEILDQDENIPTAKVRLNYREIAEAYNNLRVGQVLKRGGVYNITSFRKNLERRLEKSNFEVYQRNGACFLKRKTAVLMEVV